MTAFPFPEVECDADALITLCGLSVAAGVVSARCFFWVVYRGHSSKEWQREMQDRFEGTGAVRGQSASNWTD